MKFADIFIRRISNLSYINEKLVHLQQKCVSGENRHEIFLYTYNLIKEYKLGFMDSRIDAAIEYSMLGIPKNEIPSYILPRVVYILSKSMKKHHLKSIYDHFVFSIPFIPYSITYNLSLSLIKNGFDYNNNISDSLYNYLSDEIDNFDTPALVSLARLIEYVCPKTLSPEILKTISDRTMKYIKHFDSTAGELLRVSINFMYLGANVHDILPHISNIISKLDKSDHHNLIIFCDIISKKSKSEEVFKFMKDSYTIIIDNRDIKGQLKIRFLQAFARFATIDDNETVSNILKWISYGDFTDIKIINFLYILSKLHKLDISTNKCKSLAKAIAPHINLLIDDMDSCNLSLVSQSMGKLNNSLLSRINFTFNKLLNDKYSTVPVNDFINVFWYLCKFNAFDKSSLKSTYRFIKIGASGFSIRDISQILMGFSKISVCPPFSTFSSIYPSLISNLNKCNSLDISYILIGLSNLKNNINISEEYMKMVNYIFNNSIKLLKSSAFNFNIHELTTIIKALSKSKYKSQTLLGQLYGQMYIDGIKLSYYRQSEILLTLAHTGFKDESLMDRYLHSILSSDKLSFKTISNILIFMSLLRNNCNVISNYDDVISKLILSQFHTFPKWLKTICFITSTPNVSVQLIDFLCIKDLDEKESYRCFLSLPRLLSIGMDKKILMVSKYLSPNVRRLIPELSTDELLHLLMACYDLGYTKPKLIRALRSKIVENCCNYRFNVSELVDVCNQLVWINAYEKLPSKLQASIYRLVPNNLREKLTISEHVPKKIELFTPSNLGPPSI